MYGDVTIDVCCNISILINYQPFINFTRYLYDCEEATYLKMPYVRDTTNATKTSLTRDPIWFESPTRMPKIFIYFCFFYRAFFTSKNTRKISYNRNPVNAIIFSVIVILREDPLSTGILDMFFRKYPIIRLLS
jgi:hypothetical protein